MGLISFAFSKYRDARSLLSQAVTVSSQTARTGVSAAKHTARTTVTLVAVLNVILWISVFIYGSFYFAYLPQVSITKDVNLQFSSACDGSPLAVGGVCSFPTANFSILNNNQVELLARGQRYHVSLELDMPETGVNQNAGMFMVLIKFYSYTGQQVAQASRAAILRYKSWLLQTLETCFFSLHFLFGWQEQKQTILVELFNSYLEDPYKPTMGAYVEVQSRNVHIYLATLRMQAQFTGLRYLLAHYPVISAVVGVSIVISFLSIMALLSWYNFLRSPAEQDLNDLMTSASLEDVLSELEDLPTTSTGTQGNESTTSAGPSPRSVESLHGVAGEPAGAEQGEPTPGPSRTASDSELRKRHI